MSRLTALLRLVLRYAPWLVGQLVISTIRLAVDVSTPGSTQSPRIVKLDMSGLTGTEIALLTSSITITPGTLVLAVAPADHLGGSAAFVQGLFGEDEAELVAGLEEMRDHVTATLRGRSRT